jgi:hypothetical protein
MHKDSGSWLGDERYDANFLAEEGDAKCFKPFPAIIRTRLTAISER